MHKQTDAITFGPLNRNQQVAFRNAVVGPEEARGELRSSDVESDGHFFQAVGGILEGRGQSFRVIEALRDLGT